jgi:hypothetical protein
MLQLTPTGQQAVNDIAQRHGFSFDAVQSMLQSVLNGNGGMAQFSHPEFGGSGQWMRGGMTMIGDMFNNYLKNRVSNLCADLAQLINNQPGLIRTGSFQSQSQNGQTSTNSWGSSTGAADAPNPNSLFVSPPPQADWWGPELRWPNSSGSQNGARYAWFSQARRLAIEVGGQVTIYDTLDHQIGGVAQQQGSGGTVSFSSQYGNVDVSRLPIISINGKAPLAPVQTYAAPSHVAASTQAASAAESDIFASLEKLAALQARGILTDQEYASKKAELLARL